MEEKDIINKIELLKELKPNQEWVSSVKQEIFEEKKDVLFFPLFKPTFATVGALMMLGGIFFYSNSMIGVEQQRAEQLTEIAKQAEVANILSALSDLREAKISLKKNFSESIATRSQEDRLFVARSIAPSLVEFGQKEEEVMSSEVMSDLFGIMTVDLQEDSLKDENKEIAYWLISDLEGKSLTEDDLMKLDEARSFFEKGEYEKALRAVLMIGEKSVVQEDEEQEEAGEEQE